MLSQLKQLKLKASILQQLMTSLTESELEEFNDKYGAKLSAIDQSNSEKYSMWLADAQAKEEMEKQEKKKRSDEHEKKEEEAKLLLKTFQETRMKYSAVIDNIFDPMIDAGEQAVRKLNEETPTLSAFYKYFGCNETLSAQDVLNNFQAMVDDAGCDYYDYGEAVQTRFLELLSQLKTGDMALAAIAGMLRIRNMG